MVIDLYQKDGFSHLTPERFKKTVDELNAHPDKGEICVIEREQITVGYIILVNFWSNDATGNIVFLDEFYILPDHRNQGIGTWVLEYLRSRFQADNAGIMLETTPYNQRVIPLYKRFGFIPAENNFWQYMFRKTTYPQ